MTDAKIITEDALSMGDLLQELRKVKKRDGEVVSFRVTKVEEYLSQFLKQKSHVELLEKLHKLEVPRLKDMHLIKIVDLMPASPDEVKMVLQAYPLSVSAENLKKIADVVREFSPAKKE
ncbi:hypothetical protein J4439_07555 [Candidatus Woesearchaeota archaeon]|nr:hypothetical protein [Candidatus Woesearchaeota archaeon]